jgi:hypothetical protein
VRVSVIRRSLAHSALAGERGLSGYGAISDYHRYRRAQSRLIVDMPIIEAMSP